MFFYPIARICNLSVRLPKKIKHYKIGDNGKELDESMGYNYYGARYYDPAISIFLSVDPLAEQFPAWNPYHYVHNNPINLIDPTGMEGEEWVKENNTYKWDDRVKDQKTATEYHGKNARYIGVNTTVSTVRNGESVDAVRLNDDGTVTKNGTTLGVNSSKTFTNEYGSVFKPKQTQGSFLSIGFDGALIGGFGVQVGLVNDAVGNTDFFINFNGNIGFGGGAGWDAGTVAPTGNNQFLNSDFAGNSGGYNAGVSTPLFDASWTKGGSVKSDWHATDKMNPSKFGDHRSGYRTNQAGFGSGGSWRVGGMYSFGTTKTF